MSKSDILLESGTNELEIIEFFVNARSLETGEMEPNYFGVNVAKVLEVIESPGLRHPESAEHPCFMGTLSLRGRALPVLDLAVWLEMDKTDGDHDVILVTEFNQMVTGFLVSGVTQIHRVSWTDVESPSGYLANMPTNCMTGLVQLDDRFVQLLDLEKILAELNPEFGHKGTESGVGTGLNALVADDSSAIRTMLAGNLREGGFNVHTANNGEDALTFLLSLRDRAESEGRPVSDLLDIVISDIEMPQMDGYTLTRNIKEDSKLKNLPVILFSSLITDSLRHKGESVGADEQISKPEFGELAKRSVALIEAARQRA